MSSEAFKAAQKFVLRFGKKYNGLNLDKIAETDEGLLYLDWLRGQEWVREPLKGHLTAYMTDPTIKKELEAADAKRRHSR